MKNLLILICLLGAACPSLALDFKGVVVGAHSTPESVESELGGDSKTVHCGSGLDGMQICNGYTTVAGAVAKLNLVIDSGGQVIRIDLHFPSAFFERVEEAVLEKQGKPLKTDRSQVQNRMGATFTNISHQWIAKNKTTLTLTKYASGLDSSDLYFGSPADTALFESLKKQRAHDL